MLLFFRDDEQKNARSKVPVPSSGPGLGSEAPKKDGLSPELLEQEVSLEARTGFMAMDKRTGVVYDARTPEEMMMLDDMSLVYAAWQKNYRGDPTYGDAAVASVSSVAI